MSQTTKIEWTDKVWNPVTGCDKVSQGCKFCYAETIAQRFWKGRSFSDVQMHEDRLLQPYKFNTGTKVFVNSMSDLFHKDVSFEFIKNVMKVIHDKPTVTFQILTKRPYRMVQFFEWLNNPNLAENFPNLWLGVSVEDQETANERIPYLLQVPVAVRFLSCEPLLG
jgi:protein gp37